MSELVVRDVVLCECGCGRPAPIAARNNAKWRHIKGQPVRFIRGHALRGKKLSSATRAKMSAAHKHGPDHHEWKGEEIAYSTLHLWLRRGATRTGICSVCGESPPTYPSGRPGTEWANLSGDYRRDLADFAEMCISCHKRFDYARRKAAAA